MSKPDRITIDDIRKAGHCVRGIKEVCEAHGVDFKDFVRNGMPIDRARRIDNAFLRRVISIVERGE